MISDPDYLPTNKLDRGLHLQTTLIAAARGEEASGDHYKQLRLEFINEPVTRELLPVFVRTCRDLGHFWTEAKAMHKTWAGREHVIRSGLAPLLDHLERSSAAPSDALIAGALEAFDPEVFQTAWSKALSRRADDPEGAITAARTLLETVCKNILERASVPPPEDGDLNKLYRTVADLLHLSPGGHEEEAFKRILGGCTSVVDGLGSLRNKIGDAHGRGRRAVRPTSRHAQLAVNLAGAMAVFLAETWMEHEGAGEAEAAALFEHMQKPATDLRHF